MLCEDALQEMFQDRKVCLYYSPNCRKINIVIIMNKYMPEAFHCLPIHLIMGHLKILG